MKTGYPATPQAVVDENELKETGLREYYLFISSLNEHRVELNSFAYGWTFDYEAVDVDGKAIKSEVMDELEEKYLDFTDAFKAAYGIRIDLQHQVGETNEDYHPELGEHVFVLNFDDLYVMSDKAKHIQEIAPFKFVVAS